MHHPRVIKTGKQLPAVCALFFLLLLSVIYPENRAYGQDLELSATLSETTVFTGEQFTLTIEVQSSETHSIQLPQLPDFNGARVISSNPSRSTSISIVNGRTSRTTSYIYTLIATETGNYRVPSINVQVDGDQRRTDPIQFEVVEKGNLSDGRSTYPDIFVRVEPDDEQPVTGQQIVASIVLYFKQGIEVTSFQPAFGWRTDGFWKEELQNISQPRAESTILDGVRYRKATLLRYALFPSRSGSLTLSEYGLTVGMRSQPNRNDPFGSFFGSGTNQRRVNLESDPVELAVAALPEREESVHVNAVGDFQINRSVSSNHVETGETFELITTIEGEGNIPLLRRPEYNLPDELEAFTPRESSEVERRGLTIRGEKSYTQQLVTRTPGTVSIPEERLAVFNPRSRTFNYITLPEIRIDVSPAPTVAATGTGTQSASPLQPVTGLAVWHSSSSGQFGYLTSTWFWTFFALPFVALIVGWWRKRYIDKLMGDSSFRRSELAVQTAEERLKQARISLQENENTKEIYNRVHKAVAGFISDKTGLPEAGLSDHELIEAVENRSVNGQTMKSLKYLLDKCNTISFAPAGSKSDIHSDIDKAENVIKDLKRAL
ncbi:protein BatD [Rhodohalobacter sp. SW132]|uniref:BatD family protein n=1 Tax=Rhodohalobacter sp. SW132 TaxID=2293433 RepID=UPI000E26AF64|nr:BatD family protein [Rhodohalobacter sp. SW132]REL25052.1 protein BatD [Rhodohalobacter sp. SW132]